jgi:hypothetical protein
MLILDLSVLNKFAKKQKFKFEDWKLAIQFFKEDSYLYKFDLRSGYHHFDICPQQQTYLGFSWNGKYFCYQLCVLSSIEDQRCAYLEVTEKIVGCPIEYLTIQAFELEPKSTSLHLSKIRHLSKIA